MQPAVLLVLSIWLASGPPDQAQDAVDELNTRYEYQRHLFPESWGASKERMARSDADSKPERDPGVDSGTEAEAGEHTTGGNPSPTAEDPLNGADDERGHPPGKTWSREGWREDLRREVEQHRGLPGDRGGPERRARERELEARSSGGSPALVALLEVLVWVVIGVCAVTVIAALVRNWGGGETTVAPAVTASGKQPQAALDAPRSEAEALAAEGRFDEAVHLLLLKTIDALVRARPGGLPEAWTSREIQRAMPMPEPARAPFGALVDTVERSLFGGRAVAESDWAECFERFQAFESAYRTRRA